MGRVKINYRYGDIMAKQEQDVKEQEQDTKEKAPKYTKEDLLTIFDEIMFSGEYREDVSIKDKLKVTFVTRSAANTSEITRELDAKKFNLMSSMYEYKALLCICYSLVAYNGKDLSSMSIENKKLFIEKLPSVVVAALSTALVDFDLKTEAALSEMDSF